MILGVSCVIKGLNSRTGLQWGLTGVTLICRGGATSEIEQALLHASVGAPDTRPATPKEESRPSGTRVPTFAPTTTMTPTLAPTALKTFAPTADLTYLSTFYAIVACAACIPALCLCFAIEWPRMHPKAREPRHPGVGGCNAPDWKDNTCRTYLRPFTLMMCGFTALGAFLLSVAYKGGSSPVAGIVLLSIGGACNLWACFWRAARTPTLQPCSAMRRRTGGPICSRVRQWRQRGRPPRPGARRY